MVASPEVEESLKLPTRMLPGTFNPVMDGDYIFNALASDCCKIPGFAKKVSKERQMEEAMRKKLRRERHEPWISPWTELEPSP